MGSYATVHFFKRLVDAFPAEKDWDRPRILIDNRCTIPSRVRVFLYNDPNEHEDLISSLADSARGLINSGVDYLIFICNTVHIFLDEVFERVPEAKNKTIHIIDTLGQDLKKNKVNNVYLLASEGTIDSRIFPQRFEKNGIKVESPKKEEYSSIRWFIEQAKQLNAGDECKQKFFNYCEKLEKNNIILGCTELPVITEDVGMYKNIRFWDPLSSVINEIKSKIQ
jgi:aspartate racemase